MAAEVPLKSKRLAISFALFSTAFFTSTMFGSQTVSNEGIPFSLQRSNKPMRQLSHDRGAQCPAAAAQQLRHRREGACPGARARCGRRAAAARGRRVGGGAQ